MVALYAGFEQQFRQLWSDKAHHTGGSHPRAHFSTELALRQAQDGYMARLLRDTLGYAGAKVGLAVVLESICFV
jgi:5-methylthioribose kinase